MPWHEQVSGLVASAWSEQAARSCASAPLSCPSTTTQRRGDNPVRKTCSHFLCHLKGCWDSMWR